MSAIKEQIVLELHKPARKNFSRRRIIIRGFDETWQADLADFRNYSRENKGYKFILVVIDCFSKYVWTSALKDKKGSSVTAAMKIILEKDKRKPQNLQTDLGLEFYNYNFKNLLQKNNINHYSTYTIMKAAIAERVIRTLKEKLYLMFSLNGNFKWYDIIDKITFQYNNRKHSTTKLRPCEIDKNTPLMKTVYSHIKMSGKRKFSIGDIVRISKQKTVFSKGYTPNWSTELFKISKINITNPTTYILEDMQGDLISGAFYDLEIQKTKHSDIYLVEKILRRQGTKVYVKWLGLDKSQNSWVENKDIGL